MDLVNSTMMDGRQWYSNELHGPLIPDNNKAMGYQYHLDSYRKYTRTEVSITLQIATYVIRDLETW